MKEPLALDGTPAGGGGGTWSAIWESAAPPAGQDPCSSSYLSADGGTPVDTGAVTPGGEIDAGGF